VEIKSPLGKHFILFLDLVSPLHPDETNKPGYGQLYIFDSAEATTKKKQRENQSYQGVWP
jgi:hypothetical protein